MKVMKDKEKENKYCISFVGYDPEKKRMHPSQKNMTRVYFTCDTLRFATRADQMEFFDNAEKIFEHLRKTDLIKMLLIRNAKGRLIVPTVEINCFLEGDDREKRFYFDESREVEIAVEGSKENKVHNGIMAETTHQKLYIDNDKQGEWDSIPSNIPNIEM